MQRTFYLSLVALALLFSSCEPDIVYKTDKSGLRYAYLIENPDGTLAAKGDILTLRLKYYNSKDSLLFNSDEINTMYRMQFQEPSHSGGCLEDAYALLHLGDSMQFLIKAYDFYEHTRKMPVPAGIDPTEDLRFEIKLYGIQSYGDIVKERKAALTSSVQLEEERLDDYLLKTNTKTDPSLSGMYYIELEPGKGSAVKSGEKLSIHYVGKLIDQSIFDNSYKRNEPLDFTLGNGDLIPGMEEGISKMHKGGKARFIIPSHLAYDSIGYGQLIPPYSTLIFEVELLNP